MITPYLPIYRRLGLRMVRGEGTYLYDDTGKKYLDFAAGIATNSFGHCHPHLVEALKKQASELWHCSNQFVTPQLEHFSQRLVDATFADSVFFSSSGTEAVEAGIKFMRRYHYETGAPYRHRIITFTGGFHGRTYGGLSAGGNDSARAGFGQLLTGFDRVPLNDLDAVERHLGKNTAGILIEPIQGEGGIHLATPEFLKALRKRCSEEGILLMCDEVQCGFGRPGSLYAYEITGIVPDIVASAKGIGGGFPLGATLLTEAVAKTLPAGSHGGTYNNNPLAMAVGNAVLDLMLAEGALENVRQRGEQLMQGLQSLAERFPDHIRQVRGKGLMMGVEPLVDGRKLAETALKLGLVTSVTVTGVIRIVPPLNISVSEVEEALSILEKTLSQTPVAG